MSFVRLWEVLLHSFGGEVGPGGIVAIVDCLEPRGFGWKPCARVEVTNNLFGGWELLLDVDDGLFALGVKEYVLGIRRGDAFLEGNAPQSTLLVSPPSEDGVTVD